MSAQELTEAVKRYERLSAGPYPDAARDAARVLCDVVRAHVEALRSLLMTPEEITEAEEDARFYTVVGYWDGDNPVPTGVIAGRHAVRGEPDYAMHPEGLWATSVQADDYDEAEVLAVQEMFGTLTDGGDHDSPGGQAEV